MSAKTLISAAEFDRLEEEEFRYELDEGELITMTRPRVRHARIEGNLYFALRSYLERNPLAKFSGLMFSSSSGRRQNARPMFRSL
jgi:Uma2 family endonuclease